MNFVFLWGVAAFLVVVTPLIYLSYYLGQKRLKAYQMYCASRGYGFAAERPGAQDAYVHIVTFFDRGYGRRWRYEISGKYNGIAFTAFQYDYTISTGRSSTTYRHALIMWTVGVSMPQFTLGPETFFTRIGEVVGFHDIDFADDPGFSNAYRLKGFDPTPVSAYFSPAIRQQLTALPGQHAAGEGSVLFFWRDGSLPKPENLDEFLATGDGVRTVLVSQGR